jgi:prevent-host-death family protein
MRVVGIRDLKNRLSEYLRLVEDGEVVLVTNRDRVVAALGPPPRYQRVVEESELEALDRLARSGLLRLATGDPPSASEPPLPSPLEDLDLQAILDETRRDRSNG